MRVWARPPRCGSTPRSRLRRLGLQMTSRAQNWQRPHRGHFGFKFVQWGGSRYASSIFIYSLNGLIHFTACIIDNTGLKEAAALSQSEPVVCASRAHGLTLHMNHTSKFPIFQKRITTLPSVKNPEGHLTTYHCRDITSTIPKRFFLTSG